MAETYKFQHVYVVAVPQSLKLQLRTGAVEVFVEKAQEDFGVCAEFADEYQKLRILGDNEGLMRIFSDIFSRIDSADKLKDFLKPKNPRVDINFGGNVGGPSPFTQQPWQAKIPCRSGSGCTNDACLFRHPTPVPFYCDTCGVSCTSQDQLDQHCGGSYS